MLKNEVFRKSILTPPPTSRLDRTGGSYRAHLCLLVFLVEPYGKLFTQILKYFLKVNRIRYPKNITFSPNLIVVATTIRVNTVHIRIYLVTIQGNL